MLTKIGLDDLEKRIADSKVPIPENMSTDELYGYANGCKQFEYEVLIILKEFRNTIVHSNESLDKLGDDNHG